MIRADARVLAVGPAGDQVEPANGRRVLILQAAADAQLDTLDCVGQLGDLLRRAPDAGELVEHSHQSDDEGGRRAEARTRRCVGMQEEVEAGALVRDEAPDCARDEIQPSLGARKLLDAVGDRASQVDRRDADPAIGPGP